MEPDSDKTRDKTLDKALDAALRPVTESLAVDGYVFAVESYEDGVLRARVSASDSACADCLVPPDTMVAILRGMVPADVPIRAVHIVYPAGYRQP